MPVLFLTAFNIMLSFSLLFPIFPAYVQSMGGEPFHIGLLIAIQPFMQFVFSPFWGWVSDRVGRKWLIFTGLIGFSIGFVLIALARNLETLFAARIVGGLISSSAFPAVFAYVADITEGKERNVGMGIVGAGFGLGIVFGPFVGGILGHLDIRLAFWVSALVALLNALMVAVFLKEPVRHVRPRVSIRLKEVLERRIVLLNIMYFVVVFAMVSMEGILSILLRYEYNLDVILIGLIIGVAGLTGAVVQGSMRFIAGRFREESIIPFALFLMAISMILVPVVPSPLWLIPVMALYGVSSGLLQPNLSAFYSRLVPPDKMGAFMGIYQSSGSLGRILGPVAGTALYHVKPSIPYVVSFLLLTGVSLGFGLVVGRRNSI